VGKRKITYCQVSGGLPPLIDPTFLDDDPNTNHNHRSEVLPPVGSQRAIGNQGPWVSVNQATWRKSTQIGIGKHKSPERMG